MNLKKMKSIKIGLFIILISIYTLLLYMTKFKSNEPINLFKSKYKKDNLDSVLNPEFKTNLQIILEPTGLCKFKTKFIFIYIFTAVKSFTKRQIIRDTWANKSLNLFNFNLAFIIGKTNHLNATIDKMLNLEQHKYNDLIQGDFIDAYRNLSYKSLIAWKWIKDNCNQASYVFKLDDDILLNTVRLKNILNNYNIFKSTSNSLICNLYPASYVIRDLKSPYSKWFVTQNEYNSNLYKNLSLGNDAYPPYCHGVGIVMTPDIISKLYFKAFEIKLFWIDDVYVGILGKYINVQFENIAGQFSGDLNRAKDILFISGAETSEDVNKIWQLINHQR